MGDQGVRGKSGPATASNSNRSGIGPSRARALDSTSSEGMTTLTVRMQVSLMRPRLTGLLPRSPAHPGSGFPSASLPCCDRTEAKVSHLHSSSQRLTAHVD